MMIKAYSLLALQKAINRALQLDPQVAPKLKYLEGKVIQMVIKPLDESFFMCFVDGEIQLHAEYNAGEPDTIIHSSPIGLIRLSLLPSSKVRSLFNDQIEMSGDTVLGQTLKNIFDEIDIDWEGHLAHFTGDIVAHGLGRIVRKGVKVKAKLSESLKHNVSDYLQEEADLTPQKEALEDFYNDVDALVLQVERLEAHLHQAMANITSKTS